MLLVFSCSRSSYGLTDNAFPPDLFGVLGLYLPAFQPINARYNHLLSIRLPNMHQMVAPKVLQVAISTIYISRREQAASH